MTTLHDPTERAALVELVLESLRNLLIEQGRDLPDDLGTETALLGKRATVDSLGLVTLIVELEQRIEEQYDLALTLADDRAMSQQRSPFRTVGTLADYVATLIAEQRA